MDANKIEGAIIALFENSSRNQKQTDQAAADYLKQQFDTTEKKFKYCLGYIFSEHCKEAVTFWCMQQLVLMSQTEHIVSKEIYEKLLMWVRDISPRHPLMIRNKFAQFLCHVFEKDYPTKIPSLFTDLISISNSKHGAYMLLSLLDHIFEECFSHETVNVHTKEEIDLYTKIKDYMRKDTVKVLMGFLANMVAAKNSDLSPMALRVMSQYFDWFDFSFISNQNLIKLFYELIHIKEFREGVLACFTTIVNRGMPPIDRLKFQKQIQVNEYVLSEKENWMDLPFAALCNDLATVNLEIFKKLRKENSNQDATKFAFENLDKMLPLMFKMYSNVNTFSKVFNFFQEYTNFLAKSENHPNGILKQIEMLIQMSRALTLKLDPFDDNYEEEINNCFVIFKNVAKQHRDFVFPWIRNLFESKSSSKEIEMNLRLFYHLGESFPVELNRKQGFFHDMFYSILSSDYGNQAEIQLAYFDVFSRYCSFLQYQPKLIPKIEIFVDTHGIRNPNDQVKKKACIVFKKVVKNLKPQLVNFVDDLYKYLKDFLKIQHPFLDLVSLEDQVFLYEAMGWLLSDKNVNPTKAMDTFSSIVTPLIQQLKEIKTSGLVKYDKFVIQMITCINGLVKGFSTCPNGFYPALKSILQVIGEMYMFMPILKPQMVALLKILIPALKKDIYRETVSILQMLFASQKEIEELNEIYDVLMELLSKVKGDCIPLCKEILRPLREKSSPYLSIKIQKSNQHLYPEYVKLSKNYLLFIEYILAFECGVVILQGDQFKQIMENLWSAAHNYEEPVVIFGAFRCLYWFVHLTDFTEMTKEILTLVMQTPTKVQLFDPSSHNIMAMPSNILSEMTKILRKAFQKNSEEFYKWFSGISLPVKFKEALIASFNEKQHHETLPLLIGLYK